MKIRKYVLKRIISIIPVLLIISFLSFALMNLAGGDPAEIKLTAQGTVVTPELIANAREEMGLNAPFITQYINWLKNAVQGDLGVSYATGMPVTMMLKQHLPYTLLLTAAAMLLTLLIAIPLGILAAVKQDGWIDYIIRGFSFIGNSIPGFFLALVLLMVFSLKLKLLPVLSESGMKSIILPSVTLAVAMVSKYIRQIRVVVIEELQKDYVRGLKARGIKAYTILYHNVLKNIMVTIITLTGLSIGSLIGGTAVVESIFVWPGMGSMVLNAISNRDYPIIQGYVLWMGCMFVLISLIVDVLYKVVDPRVRAQ